MNKRLALILVVVVLALSGASVAFAQHNHSASSTQPSATETQGDSMQECQKHHFEGAAALDQAQDTLAGTKQLTDADQLKTAIESAQKSIAEAKHHLSMCPMAQGETVGDSAPDHSQHEQHKMKCMSKDSQSH